MKSEQVEESDLNWYIIVNNQTRGPLSLRDLDVLLRTNDINSRTYCWKNGLKQWTAMTDIQELKQSIFESSKEIIEIEKRRESMITQNQNDPNKQEKQDQNQEDQQIENKDQNPLTILQTAVDNLIQKSFHQSSDGKWNIYDEDQGIWVQEDQEPTDKMNKMKTLLFNKLKNQLFFDGQHNRMQKYAKELKKDQEKSDIVLTPQELAKKQKNRKKTIKQTQKKKEKWYNAKVNTFIYISGLPLNVTPEEIKQFASKAGVLRMDLSTGHEKIKIYKDENGFPKGDAAVSYMREESIDLALEVLNGQQIRSGFPVIIQRAKFNQKEIEYKKRENKRQTKVKKIQAKMHQKKQLSWEESVDQQGDGLKIVILKNVIDIKQTDNEEYLQKLKKDIEFQIGKIGLLKRIKIYETHPEGIVEVKFDKEKDATECIQLMNGKYFDDNKIQCDYWDGVTDFKRDASSLLLQQERLLKFAEKEEIPLPKNCEEVQPQKEKIKIVQNQNSGINPQ